MIISVVVSTYNGHDYLVEQLDSLRNQTIKIDQVLIADDQSSDDTVKLAQAYIDKYKLDGWSVKVNAKNKGWRRNFMEAMWASYGDLIFPCDQDDIWRNDKVEIMTKIMDQNPQINILSSDYCEFFEDGKEKIGPWPKENKLIKVPLTDNYLLVKSPGCTYCVRRELLELSKKYWLPEYPHDALLWRLGLFSNTLYAVTDDLIKWRNHSTSAFAKESRDLKSVSAKKQWINTAKSFDETMRRYVEEDVSGDKQKQFEVLAQNDRWLAIREKFYNKKSVIDGLKLAKYWGCYPRKRQYLGDWYLVYIKKQDG